VCVRRLVTMVRRGTVFSPAAFRYADVMIGAIVSADVEAAQMQAELDEVI
jgi:hypothetical protein